MINFHCLTQQEFESLEDGTEVQFLELNVGKYINGYFSHKWKWVKKTFRKSDLEHRRVGYFTYGRYRIKI